MAGVRVELLVVLTATLLVSVEGWVRLKKVQRTNVYESRQRSEPRSVTLPDDSREDDDGEDAVLEDSLLQVEGATTSGNFYSFANHGDQTDAVDSSPRTWRRGTDGGFEMEFEYIPSRSHTSSTSQRRTGIDVVCSDVGFQITLPTGSLSEVKVVGSKDLLSVMDAPESCGYEVNPLTNTLAVPFTGCYVKRSDRYSLQLLYVNEFDQTQVATASCERSLKLDPGMLPRSSGQSSPTLKYIDPIPERPQQPASQVPPTPKTHGCGIPTGEQMTCGQSGILSLDCEMMGCCVDSSTSACYYPMDECTVDQHFVFAIRANSASIPVDPTKLVITGSTNCKPVIANDKVAIFKFNVTECGVHAYEVGETMIYLAEVQTAVQSLTFQYGIITTRDPLRFMVECRYSKAGIAPQSLASAGYMVKTPSSSLPSAVLSNGLYAVDLRIAKDQTYSSYLPTNNRPLRLLLGNPVYLELRLISPKPDAVILVNYCVAYPRSARNALVLIYEGCPNLYAPNVSVLKIIDSTNRHQRRFVVEAFQFIVQKTNRYLDEEIYFMCSTEVCFEADRPCEQRCFDEKAP
ncbi:zona pellucida sperm-binding protein 4-like isoform X1 [Micropterus salmoides]|uniref:zona pellucida sperm-binding protein 4-like isoform X1 n=1 Tax=Micropterus salmoides TaxID=27706 RepID=UPI0018EB04C9|nr:zona pellucida sperm-binding protein 4-like isoform X1 [Micropterus salmoides]